MKILWVTNSILPELAQALKIKHYPYEGWLIHLADQLAENGIELTIATAKRNMDSFSHKGKKIDYYLLKNVKKKGIYDKSLEDQWSKVISEIQPDIIHLQGSENAHALALINTHPNKKYILSLQGLISICARYYRAGLSRNEIFKNLTLRFLIRGDSILSEEKEFYKRGETIEKEYFNKINNFIGRTEWDKIHSKYLNRKSNYFYCSEMLRPSFYDATPWSITKCKKHSIFLSQGNYPLKGFHKVLKAVSLIKEDFPDIEINFAGRDILLQKKSLMNILKQKNYGKYLNNTIKKLNLSNNVTYLGTLNESEMVEAYKNANLFICPSSIENSPNSLAEAQILGVPCIASNVGGIPDMINHKENGLLYRFEEVEQLAEYIMYIFDKPTEAINIGANGRKTALERHNKKNIINQLLNIYKNLLKQSS